MVRFAIQRVGLAQCQQNFLRGLFRARGSFLTGVAQVFQHHHKLVPALPGHGVVFVHAGAQAVRYLQQQRVSPVVALGFVQGLEVVQIKQQQGTTALMPGTGGQGLLQAIHQQAPVGQARQRVVEGEVTNLLFSGFALAQVHHGQQVVVPHQHARNLDRALLSIPALDGIFRCRDGTTRLVRLRQRTAPGRTVAGAQLDIRVGLQPPLFCRGDVFLGVTADLHKSLVAKTHAPIALHQAQAHRQALQDVQQPLLVAAQRFFHLLARGDVLHHGDVIVRVTALRPHGCHRQVHPHFAPVFVEIPLLDTKLCNVPSLESLHLREPRRLVVRVADFAQAAALKLFGRVSNDVAVPLVDALDDPCVGIDLGHPHGGLVEQGAKTLLALTAGVVRGFGLDQGDGALAHQHGGQQPEQHRNDAPGRARHPGKPLL